MARCYRLHYVRSLAAAGPLAKPEDHELSRLHRRHADLDDQLALIADLLWIELFITFDIERLLRREPKQHAIAPAHRQEGARLTPHLGPQILVVRLEDHPLGAALKRLLDVSEQPPHAHIAPG